jgi:hypothetical protein
MRTEKEVLKRIEEQKQYVQELKAKKIAGLIDTRYYVLKESAFGVLVELEKELTEVRSYSAEALLREALFAFNKIPNAVYSEKSTYWLASQINKYLKTNE